MPTYFLKPCALGGVWSAFGKGRYPHSRSINLSRVYPPPFKVTTRVSKNVSSGAEQPVSHYWRTLGSLRHTLEDLELFDVRPKRTVPPVYPYVFLLSPGTTNYTPSIGSTRGWGIHVCSLEARATTTFTPITFNQSKMAGRVTTVLLLVGGFGAALGWQECAIQSDDRWEPAAPRSIPESMLMDYERRYTCTFRPGVC